MNALKPKVSLIFQKSFPTVRIEHGQRMCARGVMIRYSLWSLEANAKLAKKKGAAPVAPGEEVSPTIYVENLPSEANESMLNLLFQQFPGFKKRNCAHPNHHSLHILKFSTIFGILENEHFKVVRCHLAEKPLSILLNLNKLPVRRLPSRGSKWRQKKQFSSLSPKISLFTVLLIWVQHALNVTSKLTIRLNFPLPFILYP